MRITQIIQNHAKPCEHCETCATTTNHTQPRKTMLNHTNPHKTTRNHMEPCQTMQNIVKPLITTIANIQKPFKPDLKKNLLRRRKKMKVVSRVASISDKRLRRLKSTLKIENMYEHFRQVSVTNRVGNPQMDLRSQEINSKYNCYSENPSSSNIFVLVFCFFFAQTLLGIIPS